jgi:hypothetical protein
LVRIVTEVPLTVAVAVLMTLPVLLVVGVVPPPLLVGVVPPVEGVVPEPLVLLPVLLPQAATRTMSVANTKRLNQVRILTCEVKRLLCIMFSFFASGDTYNENESNNDLMIITN